MAMTLSFGLSWWKKCSIGVLSSGPISHDARCVQSPVETTMGEDSNCATQNRLCVCGHVGVYVGWWVGGEATE